MLLNFATSLCRDRVRAEDLVQETILRAIAHQSAFTTGTNLAAWLSVILRNLLNTERRKRRREVEDADGQIAGRVAIEDSPLRKMEAQEILELIEKMPEQWRVTLRLLADGATYEEVAEETREHVGTVKSRAHRGRELLKAASA